MSADLSGGAQEVYEVIDIRSSGLDDHLWIITRSGYPGQERERRATLVDLNGDVLRGPFPIPAHPVAGSEVGVLFNAGGHGYLVDEAGVRDLGESDIAAAAGRFAGRIRCSAEAQCHPQSFALDPATGSYDGTRIPTEAAAAGAVTVSISPDGSLAVLPVRFGGMSSFAVGSGQTTSLLITPRDAQPRSVPVDNARSAPTWLPDNNGLLLLTGLGLRYYSDVDSELASRAIANLLPEDATSVLYVPPGNRDD